ncbi:MAG: SHD1 domain-containing protein [Pirellula sp.]
MSLSLTIPLSLPFVAMIPKDSMAQEKSAITQSWTDSTGKRTIEAEFVKLDGVQLLLRKTDGKEVTLPLYKLDDKSRLLARSIAKHGLSSPAAPLEPAKVVEFPSTATAVEFKDVILRELQNKNPMVLWDALPASKQKQVEDLVQLASTRVEQRTLDLVKTFRKTLLETLTNKKQFVLNSKVLPIPPDQRPLLEKSYDSIVALVEAMVPPEFLEVKSLQETSMRDLLAGYVANVATKSDALDRLIPTDSPLKAVNTPIPDDVKIENISASQVMVPGMGKFVLSEGRWLPEEMLKSWNQFMGQATQAVQSSDPKAIHKAVGQGIFAANLSMGAFVAAETQQDFDDALQQLMGMASMMQGMMAGGPGGPGAGPGGFGPSPGGPGGFGKGGPGNSSAGPGPGGNSNTGPGAPLPGLLNSGGSGSSK